MRQMRVGVAALCALLAAGQPARATVPRRSAKAPSKTEIDRNTPTRGEKEARIRFQRAEKAFSIGKFDEALAEYESAYEALPLPAFVFNIAQCYRNLGDHERAVFFYRRYLALEPSPPNKGLVQELIAEEQISLEDEEAKKAREAAEKLRLSPQAPTPGQLLTEPNDRAKPEGLTRKWWFWTAVGGVVVLGAAALLIKREGAGPQGSLGAVTVK